MRNEFLPFCQPWIGQEEIDEVVDTLRSDWLTTGPKTKRFEKDFAQNVGTSEALALSSCTAGLHLALVALGVGPGDEVITTPLTFAATVNVIEHVGARPVLVDVRPDTLNIDPQRVAAAVTPRTKVIVPVHFAGHPADLDELDQIAAQHGLSVLEDAAHAIGASYRGHPIGHGGRLASFSFYATKNMTTGEGGMLTGAPGLIETARMLSLHGLSRDAWKRFSRVGSWFYEVQAPGFKYNMTDIQASLGIWQLRKLARFQARRRQIADAYNAAFQEIEGLQTPVVYQHVGHAWHLYILRIDSTQIGCDRDEFIEQLKARQIGTSVHFIPIHLHPYYREKYGFRPDSFPVANHSYQTMLSLPLHPKLSDQDVKDVVDAVTELASSRRCGKKAA